MSRTFFSGLLVVSIATLLSISRAQADTPSYMSLGYQKGQWDLDGNSLDGGGWFLDGAYYLGQGLSLIGEYSKSDYDVFTSSEWQLGGRWSERGFSNAVFGMEYRYISLNVNSANESGHRGMLDFSFNFGSLQTVSLSRLELAAGMTSYASEDRELVSVGYRSYLNRSFSLALHLQQESDDRRWLTLSVREEK